MWAYKNFNKLLLEGPPRIGKTRTIRNIYKAFEKSNAEIAGFVTGDFKL